MRFSQQLPAFLLLFSLCLLETPSSLIECLENKLETSLSSSVTSNHKPDWKIEFESNEAKPSSLESSALSSSSVNGLSGTRRRPSDTRNFDLLTSSSERRQVQVVRNANGEYVVVPVVPSFHNLYRGYANRPNGSNSAISGLQAYRASQTTRSSPAFNSNSPSSLSSGSSSAVASSSSGFSSDLSSHSPTNQPINSQHQPNSPTTFVGASPSAPTHFANRRRPTNVELITNVREPSVSIDSNHENSHNSNSNNNNGRTTNRNRARPGMFRTSIADHLLDERPNSSPPMVGSAVGSFFASNQAYSNGNQPYRSDSVGNSFEPETNANRAISIANANADSTTGETSFKAIRPLNEISSRDRSSSSNLDSSELTNLAHTSGSSSFHRPNSNGGPRANSATASAARPEIETIGRNHHASENRARFEDVSPRVRLEEAISRTRSENANPKTDYAVERNRARSNSESNDRAPSSETSRRTNWRETRLPTRSEEDAASLFNKYESAYLDRDREVYEADKNKASTSEQLQSTPSIPNTTEQSFVERDSRVEANAIAANRPRSNQAHSPVPAARPAPIQNEPKVIANEFDNSGYSKPDHTVNRLSDYDDYSEPETPRNSNERNANRNSNSRSNAQDYSSMIEERQPLRNNPSAHRSESRESSYNEGDSDFQPSNPPAETNQPGPSGGGAGGRGRGRGRGRRRFRQRMRSTTTTTTTTTAAPPIPHDYEDNYYDYDDYDYHNGEHGNNRNNRGSTTTTTTTTTTRPRFAGRRRGPRPGRNRYRPYGRFGQGRRDEYDNSNEDYANPGSSQGTTPSTPSTTPTTTTPTTTTRKLSPNYKPRPDGRIIDYNSDPNFPYELKGADLTNYPFYISIPEKINFNCEGRHDGYYASIEHSCQIYHHCAIGHRYDFLCPNYTLFDQTTFTCRFVNTVDCEKSEKHFNRNDDLYVEKNETDSKQTPKRK